MDYQEFLRVIERKINLMLKGVDHAVIQSVLKNNGVRLYGISIISSESNASPTFYLEEFYTRYQEGRSLTSIVDEIMTSYRKVRMDSDVDLSVVDDYEKAKDQIVVRLINTKRNQEFLKTVPSMTIKDLSLTCGILMKMRSGQVGTIQIRNDILNMWGITREELFAHAIATSQQLLPPCLYSMKEMMAYGLMPGEPYENLLFHGQLDQKESMYVLTNATYKFGAAVIAYPNMLDQLERLFGSYMLVPSSVHELLIVPIDGSRDLEVEDADEIVRSVNQMEVAENEILSDHVYFHFPDDML